MQKNYVGKIIAFLILCCITAAMTEIRLNPKIHHLEKTINIEFENRIHKNRDGFT